MSPLDRRQVLRILGAIAAAGIAGVEAGCATTPGGPAAEQPSGLSITVGLISPALGPYSKIGSDITNGFKLFLEDNAGLIGRHRVELRTAEEGPSAASAAAAVEDLLAQRAMALVGLANPDALRKVATLVDAAKVPLISCGAAAGEMGRPRFVWQAGYVEGEAGLALAPYAAAQGSRAFVLSDGSAIARPEVEAFVAEYERLSGAIVGTDEGTSEFSARLAQAGARDPDVIFAAYTGEDAEALLEAFRKAGLDGVKLIGPGTLTETADLSKVGGFDSSVYTSMFYAPDLDNESNRRFVASFHKKYDQQPSSFAMAAYDSAAVLDKAFRLVHDAPTADGLQQALAELGQIDSPRGTWTFNEDRTPQQRWYLRKLRLDGQLPANLMDADLAVLS